MLLLLPSCMSHPTCFFYALRLNTIPPKDELDMNENSLIHEYISSIRDSFEVFELLSSLLSIGYFEVLRTKDSLHYS